MSRVDMDNFLFNNGIQNHHNLIAIQNLPYRPYTATSRWLPVKLRHFQVTSGHVRSRDVISCPVAATSWSYCPVGAQTYPKLDL